VDSPPPRKVVQNYKMTSRHQIKIRVTMRFLLRQTMVQICAIATIVLLWPLSAFLLQTGYAQNSRFVYGLGTGVVVNTDDGFGFGFRGRVSTPASADLSFAGDLGVSAYFLNGRKNSAFALEPQLSAIVTMPGNQSAIYFMTGFGAYVSSGGSGGDHNGPTLHIGVGGAKPLNDGTLFYEINPAVIIKKDSIGLSLPVRVGIIL
jgi:hypothetical protein